MHVCQHKEQHQLRTTNWGHENQTITQKYILCSKYLAFGGGKCNTEIRRRFFR